MVSQAKHSGLFYAGQVDLTGDGFPETVRREGERVTIYEKGAAVWQSPAAWRVVDATRMISITANLGDTKSTITHPGTTTHGRISAEARAAAGIGEGLLRVAVGLESVEDLKSDLARGLG